jgi:hypothetical protein
MNPGITHQAGPITLAQEMLPRQFDGLRQGSFHLLTFRRPQTPLAQAGTWPVRKGGLRLSRANPN